MSATERKEVQSGVIEPAQKTAGGMRVPAHNNSHPMGGGEKSEGLVQLVHQRIAEHNHAHPPEAQQELQELKAKGQAVHNNPRLNPAQYQHPTLNPHYVPEGNHGVSFPRT